MSDEPMLRAIRLACDNVLKGGRPFGAVLVLDDRVVATGVNETAATCDPTAHAELLAIRAAARALGTPQLDGAVIHASGHPCPMCTAAAYTAGIREIRYAFSLEEGARYGLDSREAYAGLMRPIDALPVRLVHAPPPAGNPPHPYDLWARRTSDLRT